MLMLLSSISDVVRDMTRDPIAVTITDAGATVQLESSHFCERYAGAEVRRIQRITHTRLETEEHGVTIMCVLDLPDDAVTSTVTL